jgi:hypothetical protein
VDIVLLICLFGAIELPTLVPVVAATISDFPSKKLQATWFQTNESVASRQKHCLLY